MAKILKKSLFLAPKEADGETLSSEFYPSIAPLKNTKALPATDRDLPIPDRRAYRSMSRAALLLSQVCLELLPQIQESIKEDPFSVGFYAAVENGPIHLPTTDELKSVSEADFAVSYKKKRNPKMYLKQLPNLAPAQVGIFLGVQGPLNVYTHSTAASLQAIDQAKMDVESGKVKYALVAGAYSFEDPLINARNRKELASGLTLSEGAGAILLSKGEQEASDDWLKELQTESDQDRKNVSYGIADAVIQLARGSIKNV